MPKAHSYLAIDIGAESGRTMLATLDDGSIKLSETYRFANGPVRLPDGLHWDVLRLWTEMKGGIAATVKSGAAFNSMGVDTWAVDYALLDHNGTLLGNPFHYRDTRTDGMLDEAFKLMPREEIFAQTGIQFMQINTLYQLLAAVRANTPVLDLAQTFVTIPDLFHYWLSGEITSEFTNATTTQCFNPIQRDWATLVLEAMQIPTHLFLPVTDPGTAIGKVLPEVATETGVGDVEIILPACHDTGSAVVAIPAQNQDFAWISSGTWSIMGAEVRKPVLDPKALQYNFTNEGGVFGTWRLSKNIMGLWLVQECRRAWQSRGENHTYAELTDLASEADAFLAVIDPDDSVFLHPNDMPEQIRSYCANTNQYIPETKGELLRVALESIALKYRWVLERLEALTGKDFSTIHIIGGGTQNQLLNQFASNSTGRQVLAGPVEATALGNVLMQSIALGHLDSLAQARQAVRGSFPVVEYEPNDHEHWHDAYELLVRLLETQSE
jgi:rhamnulokinase